MIICPNPNCGMPHENVRGKCPHCGSDFHGYVRGKHVVEPRDLGPKGRCAHGIYLHRPCPKCERSAEECEVYQRPVLAELKKAAILLGVTESQAENAARLLLAEIDKREAQQGR